MGDLEGRRLSLRFSPGCPILGATHVIDFEWMARLEVKPDFHKCGGRVSTSFPCWFDCCFRRSSDLTPKLRKFRLSLQVEAIYLSRLHVAYLTRPGETRKIHPLRLVNGGGRMQFFRHFDRCD